MDIMDRRTSADRRAPTIKCWTDGARDDDPISRGEYVEMRKTLDSRLDSHDIVLNDMLEMVHKNTNCMKEIKAKQDVMADLVLPVATGVKSIEQTIEFLKPIAKVGKWVSIVAATVGTGYVTLNQSFEHFLHK